MNIVVIKEILFALFGATGTLVAIIGLFTEKSKRSGGYKLAIGLCVLVTILYLVVNSYIGIINKDQVFADLIIDIGEPYLVNVGGTENDHYIKNADYLVVSYNQGFSLNAKIELKNMKTGEKYSYQTVNIGDGYRIANVGSGEYSIRIITDEYEEYFEYITLNSTNLGWDGDKNVWTFTAFMFDDFYNNPICFSIYLGDVKETVEYPAFGISCDNITIYQIFKSEVDWDNNGLMAGEFWGYRDVYTVSNCIEPTEMVSITIDKSE